jgi:hypothetical protein
MPTKKRAPLRKKAPPRTVRKKALTRQGTVAEPGADFCAVVAAALKRGEPGAISDQALRRVLTAAVKAYAAKAELADDEPPPFEENSVTATETVVMASAIVRAANLNLFDLAMWYRRPQTGR